MQVILAFFTYSDAHDALVDLSESNFSARLCTESEIKEVSDTVILSRSTTQLLPRQPTPSAISIQRRRENSQCVFIKKHKDLSL